MKVHFLFLVIFQLGISISSFAQLESIMIPAIFENDSVLENQFNDYLNFLFKQSNDTIIELDASKKYKVNFSTSHSFNRQHEIYDSCYYDSESLICVKNIRNIGTSTQLDFIDFTIMYSGTTKLKDTSELELSFKTYKKLTRNSHPLSGDYSVILSFDQGKYLVLSERRFGPDIRSSLPPGYDITYFLELIE